MEFIILLLDTCSNIIDFRAISEDLLKRSTGIIFSISPLKHVGTH